MKKGERKFCCIVVILLLAYQFCSNVRDDSVNVTAFNTVYRKVERYESGLRCEKRKQKRSWGNDECI